MVGVIVAAVTVAGVIVAAVILAGVIVADGPRCHCGWCHCVDPRSPPEGVGPLHRLIVFASMALRNA